MKTLALRLVHALHLVAPLPLVLWHLQRLSPSTLEALRRLFPA